MEGGRVATDLGIMVGQEWCTPSFKSSTLMPHPDDGVGGGTVAMNFTPE